MIRFRLHIFSRLISLTHLKMHKFDKSHPGPTFILCILSFLRSTGTDRFCAACGLCSVEYWRLSQCQGWKLAFEVGHAFVFESIALSVFVSFVCICIQILFVFVYKYIRVCIYVQLCGVSHCQGWWEGGVRGVRGSVVTILMAAILSSHTVSYTGQPAIYGAIYINT